MPEECAGGTASTSHDYSSFGSSGWALPSSLHNREAVHGPWEPGPASPLSAPAPTYGSTTPYLLELSSLATHSDLFLLQGCAFPLTFLSAPSREQPSPLPLPRLLCPHLCHPTLSLGDSRVIFRTALAKVLAPWDTLSRWLQPLDISSHTLVSSWAPVLMVPSLPTLPSVYCRARISDFIFPLTLFLFPLPSLPPVLPFFLSHQKKIYLFI